MDGTELAVASLQQLSHNFAQAAGVDFQAAASNIIRQTGQLMLTSAQSHAPVRTGALRASIQLIFMGPMTAVIGPTVKYGPFVQYGTAPHIIRPRVASKLSWVGPDGKRVFAKEVHHPGTKPNPFMTYALQDLMRALASQMGQLGQAQIVGGRLAS